MNGDALRALRYGIRAGLLPRVGTPAVIGARFLDTLDAFTEIDHPMAGRFKYPQHLVSMTGTPPTPGRAPLLGEHNAAILSALGYSIEEQQALRAVWII